MGKICSKFRQKNLNIVIAILERLSDGLYPSLIARQLGLRRNLIHYYVKKLENLGYVEKLKSVENGRVKTRGAITLYRVTENGSNFLSMPNRLERIENSLETFAKGMEQHMLLIRELRELVNALLALRESL